MPSPTVCTVSGLLRDPSGAALAGATIIVQSIKPFIHPTDNSLITNFILTTTSGLDGTFSINIVETTTPNVTLTLSIRYLLGSTTNSTPVLTSYTILVPNAASATLASLIAGE